MAKYVVAALFICLLIPFLLAQPEEIPSAKDAYLTEMFAHAKNKKMADLEKLAGEIKAKNDRSLTIAYSLALYIADPVKYKQQYVIAFPTDSDGIMWDLYEHIELTNLTPRFLFSFDAISSIALEGNDTAIDKVLNGCLHSDGVVAQCFSDAMEELFEKQNKKMLLSLLRFEKIKRDEAYSFITTTFTFGENVAPFRKRLAELKKEALIEVQILDEMDKYVQKTHSSK
jgi:hypothetical protein